MAGTDSRSQQRQVQSTRTRIEGDTFRRAAIVGEFPCELGDLGAENELTAVQNPGDSRINLRLDALVLHFQIEERYFSGFHNGCRVCLLFENQNANMKRN